MMQRPFVLLYEGKFIVIAAGSVFHNIGSKVFQLLQRYSPARFDKEWGDDNVSVLVQNAHFNGTDAVCAIDGFSLVENVVKNKIRFLISCNIAE